MQVPAIERCLQWIAARLGYTSWSHLLRALAVPLLSTWALLGGTATTLGAAYPLLLLPSTQPCTDLADSWHLHVTESGWLSQARHSQAWHSQLDDLQTGAGDGRTVAADTGPDVLVPWGGGGPLLRRVAAESHQQAQVRCRVCCVTCFWFLLLVSASMTVMGFLLLVSASMTPAQPMASATPY